MSEKILIASGKGGVGKSTLTAFLGKIAAEKNKKVLLVDADAGLGALDVMLGVSDAVMNTWVDAATENCSFSDAVIRVNDNLSLLPSPKFYPEELSAEALCGLLKDREDDYDYIFIDAAAGIDKNLERAAMCCDRGIFVATADEISVRCAAAAAEQTEKIGMDRENMRLVINRFVKKAAAKSGLLNIDGVIDKSGVMLLGVLPEDKKIPYFSVTGDPPGKNGGFIKAVGRIFGRTEGEYIPLNIKNLK